MADIVILKLGTALESLRNRRGDFEHYFANALGVPFESCRVADPRYDDELPAPENCRAVVITGSPEMITHDPDWSLRSENWIRQGIDQGTPFLGICYGHQLLAKTLGGAAGWTQQGMEIGTTDIDVFPDAWPNGFWHQPPGRITIQTCHSQSVHELPAGARLLASNSHDRIQGFAWGDQVWGFQFHPEFDVDIVRAYLQAESEKLRSGGRDPQQIFEQTHESDDGRTLLRAFARFAGM